MDHTLSPGGVRLANDFRDNLIIDRYDEALTSMRGSKREAMRDENGSGRGQSRGPAAHLYEQLYDCVVSPLSEYQVSIVDTLRQIAALQPDYSADNTPAMQKRGRLVRRVLAGQLRDLGPNLRSALGTFGDDFGVDASDGIGRKTEAPWVRFFSESMAPNARTGFYCVTHFAADGSAAYITVGCGATTWTAGELLPLSDQELNAKTTWAQRITLERFGTLEPFTHEIRLGAKASLPRAFEKATALARRLQLSETDSDTEQLYVLAAERLREVYSAQRIGRDQTTGTLAELEVALVQSPRRLSAGGQGFRLSHKERVAIEERAMVLARTWLESQGTP